MFEFLLESGCVEDLETHLIQYKYMNKNMIRGCQVVKYPHFFPNTQLLLEVSSQ